MSQSLPAGRTDANNPGSRLDAKAPTATNHGCTRREALLKCAGVAVVAAGVELGLAACGGSGIKVSTTDVPVGGGKILTDAYYVVTQPAEGQYRAFVNTCSHASCAVSAIRDGQIVCDCHGSRFSLEDGSVIQGPATRGLSKANVTISGDTLTVTA